MKIGVVTVVYNGGIILEEFISCLQKQTYSDYIAYFIDNASNDSSIPILEKFAVTDKFILIKNKSNLGVAAANNQGISLAIADGCDFLILCNNDMTFEPDVFQRIVEKSIQYPGTIIAPKILFGDGEKTYYEGGCFSKLRGVPWHYNYAKYSKKKVGNDRIVGYAGTAFLALPIDICLNIKMDERYFVYLDDPDFIIRAKKLGHKIIYIPNISILHFASSSTGGRYSDFSLRYVTRNTIYFLKKNYPVLGSWYCLIFFIRSFLIWIRLDMKKRAILLSALKEGLRMRIEL